MIAIDYELLQSYARGDVPSAPVTIELDTEHAWTAVEASLGTATIDGTTVTLTLPALEDAGLVTVRLVVSDGAGKRETVDEVVIAVEDPDDGWNSIARIRSKWADAPDDDAYLYELMLSARRDCKRNQPAADPATATDPEDANAYRLAEQLQTIARWTASRATNTDRLGDDVTGVTVFPMDWHVKQLLRPKTPATRGMF